MPRPLARSVALVLSLLLAPACGGDTQATATGGGGAGGDGGGLAAGGAGGGHEPELAWMTCSLHEEQDDGRAECATLDAPLFWDDAADSRRFTSYAKRLRTGGEAPTAQLWLLHGGPGASGVMQFPPMMEDLVARFGGLDVYTLDHRGVAYSQHLECPNEEDAGSDGGAFITADEWPSCVSYLEATHGDALAAYSTTQTAHDLAALIAATRVEGVPVHLWEALTAPTSPIASCSSTPTPSTG